MKLNRYHNLDHNVFTLMGTSNLILVLVDSRIYCHVCVTIDRGISE
jgi:hypothetical protein